MKIRFHQESYLKKFLEIAKKYGTTFNEDKSILSQTTIPLILFMCVVCINFYTFGSWLEKFWSLLQNDAHVNLT